MIKILHSADWHLDSPMQQRSQEQAQQLRRALHSIPSRLAAVCREEQCDLVLLSGDLFDGPYAADTLREVKTALAEMAVPVFITPGNHDFCNPESPYFTEIWSGNVHIFTNPFIESITVPQLDCRIYGAGFQSMDCPALLEHFQAEGVERYHIGLLHGDPLQRNSPYCPITTQQVTASALTYLALGHIHKAGSFTAGETLCGWPGCPMGRGNDETGEKGVYIVTLEDTVELEFIPLDTPRFYDLEAEVTTSPYDAVAALLPPVGNEDYYRITLTGEAEAFELNALQFPQFPNLEVRDRTQPPMDLWGCIGEDSLEGTYFRMLHDLMQEDPQTATLAARISRKILDGQEVVLP